MESFRDLQKKEKPNFCPSQTVFCVLGILGGLTLVALCVAVANTKSKNEFPSDLQTENIEKLFEDVMSEAGQLLETADSIDFDAIINEKQQTLEHLLHYTIDKSSTEPRETSLGKEYRPVSTNRRDKRKTLSAEVPDPITLDANSDLAGFLVREKRKAEEQLRLLRSQYESCAKTAKNKRHCADLYEKLSKLSEELAEKFAKMTKLLKEFKPKPNKKSQKLYFEIKGVESSSEEKKLRNKTTVDKIYIDHPYFYPNGTRKVLVFDAAKIVESLENHTKIIKEMPENKTKFDFMFDSKELTTKYDNVTTTEMAVNLNSTIGTTQTTATTVTTLSTKVATTAVATTTTTTERQTVVSTKVITESHPLTTETSTTSTTAEATTNLLPPESLVSTTKPESVEIFDELLPDDTIFIDDNQLPDLGLLAKPPKIHEELFDDSMEPLLMQDHSMMNFEKFMHWKAKQEKVPGSTVQTTTPTTTTKTELSVANNNRNFPTQTVTHNNFGVSGPFLSLCDQMRHQSKTAGQPIPGFTNQGVFQTAFDPGRGGATAGEATKASAHYLNPTIGNLPYPICFHVSPAPVYRPPSYPQFGGVPMVNQGGYMYAQPPVGFNAHQFGGFPITGSGNVGPIQRSSEQQTNRNPTTYCTYSPQSQLQMMLGNRSDALVGNVMNMELPSDEDSKKYPNIPDATDIVYATISTGPRSANATGPHPHCPKDQMSCLSVAQCIPKSKWCDSKVDCSDSSDEIICSCKSRLPDHKICDGYIDCPMGSDELGCFGCDRFSFSCYQTRTEFEKAQQTSLTLCYTKLEQCDGFNNCMTGKDEQECSILVQDVRTHLSALVPHTEGILHRNHKGVWYPVCNEPLAWAREACEQEIGVLSKDPELKYQALQMFGPFIHFSLKGLQPRFSETCLHHAVVVKCPPIKCGSTLNLKTDNSQRWRSPALEENRNETTVGIVGGEQSRPGALPFVVAIFRDGKFYCGGTIYTPLWIITAAHCSEHFNRHYYEVRAGILRRESYSPMVQVVPVASVIVHNRYSRLDMKNDLAMMKLQYPLLYNRWVRPICMPGPGRVTQDDKWVWGPKVGTLCTVVGWGALAEKGLDSDSLQEVTVPINSVCKHVADRKSHQICAGHATGGRDACQGDSGGPLICQSVSDPKESYLAGVVSHGEGCARPNEPGVYTRVALFLEWIHENTIKKLPQSARSKSHCPGEYCVWAGGYCISKLSLCDGFVDCLGGEDEIDCAFDSRRSKFGQNGTNISLPDDGSESQAHHTEVTTIDSTTEHSTAEQEPEETHTTTVETSTKFSEVVTHSSTVSSTYTTTSHVMVTESSTEKVDNSARPKNKTISRPQLSKIVKLFECSKIEQTINVAHRCDRVIDCEDGTDEKNCTCVDYLMGKYDSLICDGKVDCADLSDESNCLICENDEFACRSSKQCLKKEFQCDGIDDCTYKEDEKDCVTLTDGQTVQLDVNFKPALVTKGIVTKNERGKWKVLCGHEIDLKRKATEKSEDACRQMGFGGFIFHNITTLFAGSKQEASQAEDKQQENIEPVKQCVALYVECQPHSLVNSSDLIHIEPTNNHSGSDAVLIPPQPIVPALEQSNKTDVDKVTDDLPHNEDYSWPWNAEVYVEGVLVCNGVVLDKQWILTEKTCLENLRSDVDYTTVLLGGSKSFLRIQGPHEQLIRVDCIKNIQNANVALLHLEKPARFSRYVLPTFLPDSIDPINDHECAAVSHDYFGRLKTRFVETSKTDLCPQSYLCYKAANKSETQIQCSEKDSKTVGVVACKSKSSAWYPSGFFAHHQGLCAFDEIVKILALDKFTKSIQNYTDIGSDEVQHRPACSGYRCPLGNCLPDSKLCNGKPDCRDGSDEAPQYCKPNNTHVAPGDCAIDELKCSNGRCVDKTKFCDHRNDCLDLSDEPSECSCFTYLQVTDPSKICDGIRNCYDKSDENPRLCTCTTDRFRCSSSQSSFCVPYDFVCDQEDDCPGGEDERHCYGVLPSNFDDDYHEVVEQKYGVWQSKCFDKSKPPSQEELNEICRSIGYRSLTTAQARTRPDDSKIEEYRSKARIVNGSMELNVNQATTFKKDPLQRATKAIVYNRFSPLKLNPEITVYMKPSRPIAKLVSWDRNDDERCERLEIRCA